MTTENDFIDFLRQYAESEPEIILDRPLFPIPALHQNPQTVKALRSLAREAANCTNCRLSETRTNVVFGVGNPSAELMLIGEGPGADEDRQGVPFVGRAGQLLDKILAAMGLSRDDVYIANIVKCRPPKNRDPLPDEAETCIPWLKRQIEIVNPRVLVALGKISAQHLLHLNPTDSVKSVREKIHNYQAKPLVVTYHPAALLRSTTYKLPTWRDMQMVMKILSGEIQWQPESTDQRLGQ